MKKTDLEETFIAMLKANERVIYKVCSFYASEESPLSDFYQDVVCNLWKAYPKFRGENAASPHGSIASPSIRASPVSERKRWNVLPTCHRCRMPLFNPKT